MNRLPLITLICLGLLLPLLPACGPSTATTNFRDTVRSYTQQLRWGRLEGASLFIDSKKRMEWLAARRSQSRGLKITAMDIVRVRRGGRLGDEAMVDLRVVWYRQDTMTLQQADWRVQWKMTNGNWQIIDESRIQEDRTGPVKKTTSVWP